MKTLLHLTFFHQLNQLIKRRKTPTNDIFDSCNLPPYREQRLEEGSFLSECGVYMTSLCCSCVKVTSVAVAV